MDDILKDNKLPDSFWLSDIEEDDTILPVAPAQPPKQEEVSALDLFKALQKHPLPAPRITTEQKHAWTKNLILRIDRMVEYSKHDREALSAMSLAINTLIELQRLETHD